MFVIDTPAKPLQRLETLRGSIARVSCFPSVGDNTNTNPIIVASKHSNWDNWKDWDQWQDSHKK
jgi:hypothetical protein